MLQLDEYQRLVAHTVRQFVDREVIPVASEMEHRDEYPDGLVETMKGRDHDNCAPRRRYLSSRRLQDVERMDRAIEANRIKPIIDTVGPFADTIDGYHLQASGRFVGKIVVAM